MISERRSLTATRAFKVKPPLWKNPFFLSLFKNIPGAFFCCEWSSTRNARTKNYVPGICVVHRSFEGRLSEGYSKFCERSSYICNIIPNLTSAYGLDGPGIESRWGRDFPHLSRPALTPTQPPVQCVSGLPRGKVRPGRDADPSPPSSAEVKNRVELYLYSP
jgi:hypothetical protein